MRHISVIAICAAMVLGNAPVYVQAAESGKAASPAITCAGMAKRYEALSKNIASTGQEGFGDDSAARETNRQIEISNYYSEGAQILTIMASRKCALPDNPLSPAAYFKDALACATSGNTDSPACDQTKWTRFIPQ